MTAPTPERLATLVRFHSGCRPDAGCETCEVIAALEVMKLVFLRIDRAAEVLRENADAEGHDWEADDAKVIRDVARAAVKACS